jgi:hypothetical protein
MLLWQKKALLQGPFSRNPGVNAKEWSQFKPIEIRIAIMTVCSYPHLKSFTATISKAGSDIPIFILARFILFRTIDSPDYSYRELFHLQTKKSRLLILCSLDFIIFQIRKA